MQSIKILAFDVFGTVVDWHKGVMRETQALLPNIDANAFALAWRNGYAPAMEKVMSGQKPWTLIDDLHRQILDDILLEFGVKNLTESQKIQFNQVWHRLPAWPDTVAGMLQLKQQFVLSSLSNGNISLLTHMAKYAKLPWDCILSAENFHQYKPSPTTYLGVAKIFGVLPSQVLMVAAHQDDLLAAKNCGLKTAYIERPYEMGLQQKKDVSDNGLNDFHAKDLIDLAVQLGVQSR
jgi:2-haloacid dehalogenase